MNFSSKQRQTCARKTSVFSRSRAATILRLDRFSPNFRRHLEIGFKNMRHARCYDFIYPDNINKTDIAYYFDYEFESGISKEVYEEYEYVVQNWIKNWKKDDKPCGFLYMPTINGST